MSAALALRFPGAEPPSARFVLSPLWETLASIRILQTRPVPEIYRSWAESLTPQLNRHQRALSMLFSLLKAGAAYTPGFVFVPPLTPMPDLTIDLVGLRGTPLDRVREDLDLLSWVLTTRGTAGVPLAGPRPGAGPLPEPLRDLYDDPAAGLADLAQQIELYWSLAIAPLWGRIRALAAADLVHRGRVSGAEAVLDVIHPAVSWDGRALAIEHSGAEGSHSAEGNELLLMPSAFTTTDPWPIGVPPHQPLLTYPARGIQALWKATAPAPIGELAGVLGASRARLLAELQTPASTSQLAARTSITAGGASQHLAALRAAGLVTSHRTGHSVLHARTATAEALIANASATSTSGADNSKPPIR